MEKPRGSVVAASEAPGLANINAEVADSSNPEPARHGIRGAVFVHPAPRGSCSTATLPPAV
jgi:hypothetical protein